LETGRITGKLFHRYAETYPEPLYFRMPTPSVTLDPSTWKPQHTALLRSTQSAKREDGEHHAKGATAAQYDYREYSERWKKLLIDDTHHKPTRKISKRKKTIIGREVSVVSVLVGVAWEEGGDVLRAGRYSAGNDAPTVRLVSGYAGDDTTFTKKVRNPLW
jgi:hypothetical protein